MKLIMQPQNQKRFSFLFAIILIGLVFVTRPLSSSAVNGIASFQIGGMPVTTPAGTVATFTVTAIDGAGNTVNNYTGTVRFTCNFPASKLPANYTFTPADAGSHVFAFTPVEAGLQILDVFDTTSTSLNG